MPVAAAAANTAATPVAQELKTESKPTLTIPKKTEADTGNQPNTPIVTSPTPPQSPASVSHQTLPLATSEELKAVHEAPDTPPAGSKKTPKKETAKQKK